MFSEARLGCENTEFCVRSQIDSSVTNRAIRLRIDIVRCSQLFAERQLFFFASCRPSQIGHLFHWPKVRLRITVAVQTPSHRLILGLVHNVHLIHSTVARNAGYTAVHVRRMIEIDIVGQPVNPDPVDRLPSPPTLPHRLQLRRFRMDRRQLWSRDGGTQELAKEVVQAIEKKLGARPYSVISSAHRLLK